LERGGKNGKCSESSVFVVSVVSVVGLSNVVLEAVLKQKINDIICFQMVKRPANDGASTSSGAKPKKARGPNVTKSDKKLFIDLVAFHDSDGTLFTTSRNDSVKEKKDKKWEKILR
jgi:hypothetical protein